MVKRQIIKIDEEKCNGCGLCVPNCAEGALRIIDGKVRLISDLFCDGLGACIGHCPEDAIKIEEREAEPYDERRVMEENIVPAGENTIKAHLSHLKEHGADEYYNQAQAYLQEHNIRITEEKVSENCHSGGCPGMKVVDLSNQKAKSQENDQQVDMQSQLGQWPIQIHLLSPQAPYFKNADLVVLADCVAFAYANTHRDFIAGNAVAVGCPKLDDVSAYIEKFAAIIEHNDLKSIKVVRMEVPCCGGMVEIIKQAIMKAGKVLPFEVVTIGIDGVKK